MSALSQQLGLPYDLTRINVPESQLPDNYLVYLPVSDPGVSWADNKETAHEPSVQVSFFYRQPEKMLTVPDAVETAFLAAGFKRTGQVGTLPHQSTGHDGWYEIFSIYERR